MTCHHRIPNCICEKPGARQDMHGQPPKKCATCGGETGMHRGLFCPEGLKEGARIIGIDLPPREELLKDPKYQRLVREMCGVPDMDDCAEAFRWLGDLIAYLDTPRSRRALAGDEEALRYTLAWWPSCSPPHLARP